MVIKLVAFDLVGVLAYENDYELNEVEDKIERLFGDNTNGEDVMIKASSYIDGETQIRDIISKIINNIYNVRDENIISKLKELRPDLKVVVATNHVSQIREWIVKQSFSKALDRLFISAEMGVCKPSTEFYKYIADELKINKENVLFIDDSVKNIEGAKDFGMQTLLYNKKDDLFESVKKLI